MGPVWLYGAGSAIVLQSRTAIAFPSQKYTYHGCECRAREAG